MLLKTKVKVGNITNLSDARYCAGMGVDLLGFPIGNGKDQISFDTFGEIAAWVAGPEFVFECSNTMDDQQLKKVTQLASIRYIQLNFEQLDKLKTKLTNQSIILTTNVKEWVELNERFAHQQISYLIIDNVDSKDWKEIEEINKSVPVLIPHIELPIDLTDISTLPISGIALQGTSEDKPGHQNYDHLSAVLETLEAD